MNDLCNKCYSRACQRLQPLLPFMLGSWRLLPGACLPRPVFPRPEARIRIVPIVRQLAVGVFAACTVVFTASQVHPVFLGQAPVAGRVLAAAYLDSASIRAPWLSLPEPL